MDKDKFIASLFLLEFIKHNEDSITQFFKQKEKHLNVYVYYKPVLSEKHLISIWNNEKNFTFSKYSEALKFIIKELRENKRC